MKKILLVLLIGFSGVYVFGQTQRMVLLEEFTNASCNPCAQQNPEFNQLIENNLDKVVAIKFQTAGPGYDPHYYEVPSEVQSITSGRAAMYEIEGVPSTTIDGVLPDDSYAGGVGRWEQAYTGAPFGVNQAVIDYAAGIMTPLAMTLEFTVDETVTPNMLTATVEVTNMMPDTIAVDGHVLQVMMIEEENIFPYAPGTNGETEFTDIFRGMVNGQTGTALTGRVAPSESVSFEFSVNMPDYIYSKANLGMAAFIQNTSTMAVVQAAKAESKEFPNDPEASVNAIIVSSDSNCDYTGMANARVNNLGQIDITSISVFLIDQDNQIVGSASGTDVIAPGEQGIINFDDFMINEGPSSYRVVIAEVNGENGDLNVLNNLTQEVSFLKWAEDPVFTNEFSVDFNGMSEDDIPANTYFSKELGIAAPRVTTTDDLRQLFVEINQAFGTNYPFNGPMGGYGNSDEGIYVGFAFWNPANSEPSETWAFDKVSLTGRKDAKLYFDLAHQRYAQFTDESQLEVLVSTDCGETFDVVYDKTGAELATVALQNDDLYTPKADDWRTDTVDLSAYDNMDEINVIFRFTSSWGNFMYMDNINLTSEIVSSSNEIEGLSKIDLFPNPVVQDATLRITMDRSVEASISITDITGRVVKQVTNQTTLVARANDFNIETDNLKSGLYFVNIATQDGISVQKLNVIK